MIYRLRALVFASLCLALPTVALAASDGLKVGVVYEGAVIKGSVAMRNLTVEVSGLKQSLQQSFVARETVLRKEKAEIDSQGESLEQEKRQQQLADLERRFAGLRRQGNESARSIDRFFQQGQAQIHQEILKVIDAIAQEKNADLVLSGRSLLWSRSDSLHDFTDETLARLNKDFTKITVQKN